MGNKKARYKVGDTVVIKKYGTVGKITDINFPFLVHCEPNIFLNELSGR